MKKQHSLLAWRTGNLPMLLLVLFVLVSPVKSWADVTAEWGDFGTSTMAFPSNTSSTINGDINVTINSNITSQSAWLGYDVIGGTHTCYWFGSGSYVDITLSSGTISGVSACVWNNGDANNKIDIQFCSSALYDAGNNIGDPFTFASYGQGDATISAVSSVPFGAKSARIYGAAWLYQLTVTASSGCASPETATFSVGSETGITGSAPANMSACEGASFTMPSSGSLVYPGYSFAGWKLNNAGDLITAGTSYTMPAGGASFTAQWEEDNTSLRIPGSCTVLNATNYATLVGYRNDEPRDIDQDGNNDDHLNIWGGDATWQVIITPGLYSVTTTCCVFSWGLHAKVSLIDPAGIESPRVLYDTGNLSGAGNVYKSGTGTENVDLSSLTANKQYIIKAEDFWDNTSHGGCQLMIKDIVFTQLGTSHNITFAKGDESVTGSLPANTTCAEGGSYTLPDKGTLAWSHHAFLGWNDGANTYAAGASYTMGNADVAFTAVWEEQVVPAVTNLNITDKENSNVPLSWNIPGICDLRTPVAPSSNMSGTIDDNTYYPSGDYVTSMGDAPKWEQYGVGFAIPSTTGIEWFSFDYKGNGLDADMLFWGGLNDGTYTYWKKDDTFRPAADETWYNTGQLVPSDRFWHGADISTPMSQSITQVAIYLNSESQDNADQSFSVRNVRYHVHNQLDIDHVVVLRKEGSAATGIDDAAATQIYSGTKSHYTDTEVKTVGSTYYYTVYAVDADGYVSAATTVSATITNDTPHTVTYAKGGDGVTGSVPTDVNTYVAGNNVTLAAIGDLEWTGHIFMGWSDGTDTYQPGNSYTMSDDDVIFTALWRDIETPLLIPTGTTHLDANNYYSIPGGTYSFNVDGTGASTCIDIAGNNYAEWKAKFTPGHYRTTLTYGTTGWAVNVTLKIYDGDTEIKATPANTHSDDSGAHTYQVTWSLDLTDLDPDKAYKVRVIDTYGNNTSNPKVGYLDFEMVVPTDITNTATTRLDYTNVSVSPGTTTFDIKNDGNPVTCLDLKSHGQADWYVYITPDVYDINMLYGTPEYSTNVTFSIIDPATGSTVFAPAALTHSGAASTPWYEEKTWNNVDLSGLTAGKQYIVRVADTYSSTGSQPKVQYIDFAKHEVIQIGAFETILNVSNTISTVPTTTDVDIDGDGNNDACMNLNNTNAEWEVNIARGIYTMTLEYGVPNYACKVKVELIDPLGVEAPRELLYHALSNDIESGMKARIASRGCDFSDVTEDKVYKVRISDVYGGSGCPLRVRELSFNPFVDTQIPATTRLDASNVFTPNVFTYTNLDVDGDSHNDECLYLRKKDGVTPVEWRVQITPGRYDLTVAYGAVSGGYDITLYLVDPAIGGDGTSLYTNHVSSSGARYQKETITVDWTNLVAGKEYIIRAADTYSDADGCKLRLGYIDFNSYTTHTRTNLHAGDFGTVCLPYAVAAANRTGAELFEIDEWSADGNSLTISELLPDENMVAGRPYIYQATDATASFSYHVEGSEAEAGEYNGLIGSYTQEVIAQDNNNYIIYNNKLYPVNDLAYVGANRAYIHRTAATTPTPAPRRRVTLFLNGTQTATGLDGIQSDNNLQKVLVNGQLFIIRDGKTYTVQGQLVTR